MEIRISFSVPEPMWRQLRDLAEQERIPGGRASVSAVVGKIVARELTAWCASDKEHRRENTR